MNTATKARERPIVFGGPEVNAILAGRQTTFRRTIKPQPQETFSQDYGPDGEPTRRRCYGWVWKPRADGPWYNVDHVAILNVCPWGCPGDLLWCREAFAFYPDADHVIYREREGADLAADGVDLTGCWTPAICMPRWASRLTLRVESVRVERADSLWAWVVAFSVVKGGQS